MNDLVRTVIIGFLSGVAGAAVVVAITNDESSTPPVATDSATQSRSPSDVEEQPAQSLSTSTEEAVSATTAVEDDLAINETSIAESAPELSREQRRDEARRRRGERIADQLRSAGWSDMEIESLDDIRNAAALEMEQMLYDAMREAAAEAPNLSRMSSTPDTFRDSLGDEKYEQYLEASGQSTAVTVRNLLQGSAADNAGIQQGDRIRRYGDVRIYNEGDLLNALIEGTPGESVSVEVERDGTIFYVTVPRGPIGTSGISRRWP